MSKSKMQIVEVHPGSELAATLRDGIRAKAKVDEWSLKLDAAKELMRTDAKAVTDGRSVRYIMGKAKCVVSFPKPRVSVNQEIAAGLANREGFDKEMLSTVTATVINETKLQKLRELVGDELIDDVFQFVTTYKLNVDPYDAKVVFGALEFKESTPTVKF